MKEMIYMLIAKIGVVLIGLGLITFFANETNHDLSNFPFYFWVGIFSVLASATMSAYSEKEEIK